MVLELIHDVLSHVLTASGILGIEEEERSKWQDILNSIPSLQVGKHGQLQECSLRSPTPSAYGLVDYEKVEPGHRHLSHLFALFPSDQISLEKMPQLAQAA